MQLYVSIVLYLLVKSINFLRNRPVLPGAVLSSGDLPAFRRVGSRGRKFLLRTPALLAQVQRTGKNLRHAPGIHLDLQGTHMAGQGTKDDQFMPA